MQKIHFLASTAPRPLLSCLALLAGLALVPSPAAAGFQWVAPPDSGVAAAPAPMVPATLPPMAPAALPPMATAPLPIVQQTPESGPIVIDASSQAMEPGPLPPENAAPAPSSSAPMLTLPAPATMAKSSPGTGHDAPVRGFADNVPLAVALRQVLPPDVAYSINPDVSPATVVSWRGGRDWRLTLQGMLQPAGLEMRDMGGVVAIARGGLNTADGAPAGAMAMMAPQAPPAPAPVLQPMPMDPPPQPAMLYPGAQLLQAPQPPMASAAPMMAQPQLSTLPAQPVESWSANRGETLRHVLEEWSHRANVDLMWQAEYDYPLQASVTLTGSYEEAVRNLLIGFQDAQPQPTASLHNSSVAGESVLIVRARGNNYSD